MANISTDFGTWSAIPASNQPDGIDTADLPGDLRALQAALKIIFPNIGAALTPTHTEFNYVDGVTSAIQTQLNAKAASGANSDITSLTACTQITAASVTVATDDKILIKDTSDGDALKTVSAKSIADLSNGPAFSAYADVATVLTGSSYVKLKFQVEEFDTHNNYDNTTNYRFTPTVAGYYQISGGFGIASTSTNLILKLYKNGSPFKQLASTGSAIAAAYGSSLVYLNGSSDYVELFAYQGSSTQNTDVASSASTYFQAVMVRGA